LDRKQRIRRNGRKSCKFGDVQSMREMVVVVAWKEMNRFREYFENRCRIY
jgi:hypothetical protein